MPDSAEKPGPRRHDAVRLARPAVALIGVILFQLLFASAFVGVLTKEFTTAAAALKTSLRVPDLAPLPASDPAGDSLFFLVIAWMLGGYAGATALSVMLGRMRGPGLRQAAIRLRLLAGYAVISGLLGALLIGPAMGVVSGYSLSLAGTGMLLVFAAAAATAGLQARRFAGEEKA